MKHSFIVAALLAVLLAPAWAINKCKGPDGNIIYQDKPCVGAEKINLSGAGQADPNSPAANYWSREISRLKRTEKVESAVTESTVFVGMSAADARRSWGNPTKINSSIGSYGKKEQWVYDRGNYRSQYVYIENGVVTSVQSPE